MSLRIVSDFQKMLYSIQKAFPATTAYNVASLVRLDGHHCSPKTLENALLRVRGAYPILGCGFEEDNDGNVVAIERSFPPLCSSQTLSLTQSQFKGHINSLIHKPFNLAKHPPLKVYLIENMGVQHILVVTHHILTDYESISLVVRDLLQELSRSSETTSSDGELVFLNTSKTLEYAEVARLQKANLIGQRNRACLNDLKNEFCSNPLVINGDKYTKLLKTAKELKTTLPILLTSMLYIVLCRVTKEKILSFNFPLSGKKLAAIDLNSAGCFINVLPAIFECQDATFSELLDYSAEVLFGLLAVIEYPTSKLFEKYPALSEAIIVNYLEDSACPQFLNCLAPGREASINIDGKGYCFLGVSQQNRQAKLHINLLNFGDELFIDLKYCADTYSHISIENIKKGFDCFIELVNLRDKSLYTTKLNDIELLNDLSYSRLLTSSQSKHFSLSFSKGEIKTWPQESIIQVFTEQVKSSPEDVAVIDLNSHSEITYLQLEQYSNQVAQYLRNITTPGEVVALCIEPSIDRLALILGILKAQCIFMPISLNEAPERLAYILEKVDPSILIGSIYVPPAIRLNTRIVDLQIALNQIKSFSSDSVANSGFGKYSYLLFTSGTTGKPKGVLNTQKGTVNRILWMREYFQVSKEDVFIHKTAYTFDVSIWELLLPVLSGAKLIIPENKDLHNLKLLHKTLQKYEVSFVYFVPSLLTEYLRWFDLSSLPSLRGVISSGEVLPLFLLEKFKLSSIQLYNLYGPTEASIDVTCWDASCPMPAESTSVPIGYPINNTIIYILNENQESVGLLEAGELYIGGTPLAYGYYNDKSITEDRFISVRVNGKRERLYKTGDRCRWLPCGAIEFLGRVDREFKFNGQRIAPEEIEEAIKESCSASRVAVLLHSPSNLDQRLIAYIETDKNMAIEQLRQKLSLKLPSHMVPSEFIDLPKLPVLENGKTDYGTLKAQQSNLALSHTPHAQVSSENTVTDAFQETIRDTWKEVLNIDELPTNASFYELGGTSFGAMRAILKIEEALGIHVPISVLLGADTFDNFVLNLFKTNQLQELPKQKTNNKHQASSIQKRMWFLYQNNSAYKAYHIPVCIKLSGGTLEEQQLKNALKKLVDKHFILHSYFKVDDQRNLVVEPCELSEITLSVVTVAKDIISQPELNEFANKLGSSRFNLTGNEALFRCQLLKAKQADYLLFILHHILFDDVSIHTFISELAHLYQNQIAHSLDIAAPSYYEIASLNVATDSKLSYWKNCLRKYSYPINLPYKSSVGTVFDYQGDRCYLHYDSSTLKKIKQLCQNNSCSLYHFFLACTSILVSRYTSPEKFFLASTYATRERYSYPNMMGPAFDTLLIPIECTRRLKFSVFLRQVKENVLEALNNAIPYEYMLSELSEQDNLLNRERLPQLYLNWQIDKSESVEFSASSSPEEVELSLFSAKSDMAIYAVESSEELKLMFEYATKLFDKKVVEGFADHLDQIISSILDSPETLLSDIPIYTNKQKRLLRDVFIGADGKELPDILDSILTHATQRVEHIAIEDKDNTLTYGALAERINNLSSYFLREGMQNGDVIATVLPKSADQIVILLAIINCGATYLPIDAFMPQERLRDIINDAKPKLIITTEDTKLFLSQDSLNHILLKDELVWNQKGKGCLKPPKISPDSLAYLIYTSGSTGNPKGTLVSRRALNNSISGLAGRIGFNQKTRLLSVVNLGFDISLLDICATLSHGGYLYVGENELRNSPQKVICLIKNKSINHLQCTPSFWRLLLQSGLSDVEELVALSGGELLPLELLAQLRRHTKAVWDLYGPTETTVYTSANQVTDEDTYVPIGPPIQNVRYSLNGLAYDAIPIGFRGELWISGESTASGYLNKKKLTQDRFDLSRKTYKTGDIVKLTSDLRLLYQGRNDNQVKVNGNRVELGEIEHVVKRTFGLDEVVVKLFQKNGLQYLVAFYTAKHGFSYATPIASALRPTLPAYMVPQEFVYLDAFPLTRNGKIDRNNLLLPEAQTSNGDISRPSETPLKIKLAIEAAWSRALGIDTFKGDDNFFDLGGDSFKATLLVTALCETLSDIEAGLTDVFIYPTINKMAAYYTRQVTHQPTENKYKVGSPQHKIAIIGIAYKLPGIDTDEALWDVLANRKYTLSPISEDELKAWGVSRDYYQSELFVNRSALIQDLEFFDNKLFGISDTETRLLDPQQRHMLMLAHIALKGIRKNNQTSQAKVGTYMGVIDNGYLSDQITDSERYDLTSLVQKQIYADTNYIASRISHLLDLTGPSVCINTACSSGLSAVIAACDAIKAGHCNMAIAGAVNLQIPPRIGYQYKPGFIFSKTGICSPFSSEADGTVPSSAAGVFVLKPLAQALADGDEVHGVISGYAINNDGADRGTYAAPGKHGQVDCAKLALASAGITSSQVSYIESHGTGTQIGDAIEIAAMSEVYGDLNNSNTTYIGSVKANVGHGGNAAAIAGLVKSLLLLRQKIIPPQANFTAYSKEVLRAKSEQLSVNTEAVKFDSGRPYLAINSVGLGGTNCHMILEASPQNLTPVSLLSKDKIEGLYISHRLELKKFPLLKRAVTQEAIQEKSDSDDATVLSLDSMLEILSLASEVDDVDKDTPLSSLDIDSIGQVTVCAELEERFGIQCDPSMILSSKTPWDLFNLIEEHIAEKPNQSETLASLVTLSQNTEATLSIVFIHPGHGGIDCYKPSALKLAASMPVNFYAIANPLNDCEFDSIHQMAQKYLELIDSKLSRRVIFAGWSFGGVVAREMNVLRSNIQADPVILFDSWAGFSEAFNNKTLFLQKYGPIFKENYGTRWLEHLWNRVSLMTKMPITVANDRVILVKATKILAEYEGCNEEFNHWAKYVGSIEKIDFDSNHDVMFEESNLSMLVKVFEKALNKLITL